MPFILVTKFIFLFPGFQALASLGDPIGPQNIVSSKNDYCQLRGKYRTLFSKCKQEHKNLFQPPSLAYLWKSVIGMKFNKSQLIKLLGEKITKNLTKSILEQTKMELELKLENSGFDMEDFFFSDAESAARADMEKHYGNKMVHAKLGDREDTSSWLQAQLNATDDDVDKYASHLKRSHPSTFNQQLIDFFSKNHRFAALRDSDPRELLDIIGLAAYKYVIDNNAATPFITALQEWMAELNYEFDPTEDDLKEVDPVAYRMLRKFDPIYNKSIHANRLNEALSLLENNKVERYYSMVFLQGDEAQEAMDILDQEGEEAAWTYLMQNYYDEGALRPLESSTYKGAQDYEFRKDIDGETFIMNWNYGIPYIGITMMKTIDAVNFSDDKYKDLYDDTHGSYGELSESSLDKTYEYHINLDERGQFYADVRDENEKSVYWIKIGYGDEDNNPVEDGFMKNLYDIHGLETYLKDIGIISQSSKIVNPYSIKEELNLDNGELSDDPSSIEFADFMYTNNTIDDVSRGYYVVPPKNDDPLWYVVDEDGDPVSGHDTEDEAKQAVQALESNYRSTGEHAPEDVPEYGVDFKESRINRINGLLSEVLLLIKEYGSIGGYPEGAQNDSRAPWNISDIEPAKEKPKQTFSLTDSNKEIVIMHHGNSYYAFYKGNLDKDQSESIAIDYIGVPSEVERNEDGGYDTVYDASHYSSPSYLTGDAIVDYVNDNFAHLKVGDGLDAWESGEYDLVRIDQPLAQELRSTWSNLSVPIS